MLISFGKTQEEERREFDVGSVFHTISKIRSLLPPLCQPGSESNSSLGEKKIQQCYQILTRAQQIPLMTSKIST